MKRPREDIDKEFSIRRNAARNIINRLDKDTIHDEPERDKFFNIVYDRAEADPAQIPWADMAPKVSLSKWLKNNPGQNKTALDIACGLGDNAEALSEAGYKTTAFDLAQSAIDWALRRFPNSKVNYRTANLFEPPEHWNAGFDLVHECYTLQALPPTMLKKTIRAVADLVKPGGTLLVYTRLRPTNIEPNGPPWALREADALKFNSMEFELKQDERFEISRGERIIPHQFATWVKSL